MSVSILVVDDSPIARKMLIRALPPAWDVEIAQAQNGIEALEHYRAGKVDVSDPDFANRRYNPWLAYAQSKLADLMLAYELQRRLTADRSPIRSMAAHPGYSATNLQSKGGSLQSTLMGLANRLPFVAQPAAMGALPTLYAATVPDLPGGSYIGPDGIGEMGGHPRPVGSSGASHDRAVARHLWELCERLTAPGS